MSYMDGGKYCLDPNHAYLFVKALSQRAENAFGLPKNAGAVVQPIERSAAGSEIALQLTLENPPINPTAGYVFGSSEEDCDILLDTVSNRGVSSMAFRIKHKPESHELNLHCLARKGLYFRNTRKTEWKKLGEYGIIYLSPGESWTIALGSTQIGLSTVLRDHSQQRAFDRNLNGYIAREKAANPDLGRLNTQRSTTSIMDTPATRFLTGIWGNYTAAGRVVGEGGNGFITACMSKTGVSCCIKEVKAEIKSKKRFRQEIRCLRRVTHPSIVQYIDRNEEWTWMAMKLSELGHLEEQHIFQPFSRRETEVLIYQALDALSHVHSCNIIHHDIKPQNILVQTRTKNKIVVKIADFGNSERRSPHPGEHRGTPFFLAPECFRKPPVSWDLKVDVWALAMVALKLLFDYPVQPPVPKSLDYGPTSPYAEGWCGSIKAHSEKGGKEYLKHHPDDFLGILSHMFRSQPETRTSALDASNKFRRDYPLGYFFSLGEENLKKGERPPKLIESVLPADSRSDDDSIFRFRELVVQGFRDLPKPLLMIEGCYLVNLAPILGAKFANKDIDIEVATHKELENLGRMYWNFKLLDRPLQAYIRIEHALKLCKGKSRLRPLIDVLEKQKALCDEEMAGREGSEDKDSDNGAPAFKESQLSLVESIRNSDSIIAITEEGRMLLVRPKDGFLYAPSVQAVIDKRPLLVNELGDELAYMHLDGAMKVPRILSHKDVISLGAATYFSL